ncbi:MAG: tyrosine recombinase XerC [Clostridia bacterium]|nr:tyrosine recombinase XerC [Clostridia bacterium]
MKKEYMAECPPILKEYLGYIEVVKGRSSNTVNEYFTDLRTFFRFMKELRGLIPSSVPTEDIPITDIDMDFIRTVTVTDVYEYMNYLRNERSNSNSTRARKTTALRMFFRYLTDYAHHLEHNPVQNLETPKQKKSLPQYLSLEQAMALLQSASGEFAERDYCMLILFLNCGLCRAELVNINISDVSRSDNTLRVRGKGNKERMLYLNEACQQAIEQYLRVRPVDGVKDKEALFLSRLKSRITLQGVHYVIKGYLKNIDGAQNMTVHKLRHTAATLMYQNGVDLRVLQNYLGHENLGTTEIYTHLSNKQIENAAKQNPLSQVSMKKTGKRKPIQEESTEE